MSNGASDAGEIFPQQAWGSIIERLDPRTRVLSAAAFVIGAIALDTLWVLSVALLVALALVWLAHRPFSAMCHRLLHVEGFMLLLFVLLPFTTPGAPLLTLGPLVASSEGVLLAASIVLTVNASVLAIFALLSSLEPVRLGHALARLGVPLKLVHLFLFTVRYIAVFRAETGRLREAMRARAFVAGSDRHTWRTLGNLAGMMLVRSLERAERVDAAMRCRGFSGRFPMVARAAPTRVDYVFGIIISCIIIGLLTAERFI